MLYEFLDEFQSLVALKRCDNMFQSCEINGWVQVASFLLFAVGINLTMDRTHIKEVTQDVYINWDKTR
jgi:hypothetical protein